MRYWKVLNAEGQSCHGGTFTWSLPRWDARRGWIPGEWTPLIEGVVACKRGYHVCRDADLLGWLGERVYACEVRGEVVVQHSKVVAGQVRLTCPTPWDATSARLFAVECAADVLPLYERAHPGDSRVSDSLVTAFRYAVGDATVAELDAAALDTAWAARRAVGDARQAAWTALDAAVGSSRYAPAAATQRLLWWLGATSEEGR